ncbi:MAG: carbohydrate porin [Planctomycetota bacterium]
MFRFLFAIAQRNSSLSMSFVLAIAISRGVVQAGPPDDLSVGINSPTRATGTLVDLNALFAEDDSCFVMPRQENSLERATAEAAARPCDVSLCRRSIADGDWLDWKSELAESGIAFNGSVTQFYQGVASGGTNREFEYGAKGDYFLNLDGGKLGIGKGLFITLHGESRWGQDINGDTGTLLPPNAAMLFPKPGEEVTALTSFKFTQMFSEQFGVFFGKINLFDEYALNFGAGRGLTGFMNTSLLFPPVAMRTMPYSTYGAGAFYLHEGAPLLSLSVFDAVDRTTTVGLDDLFSQGAVLTGSLILPTKFFDLPGHQYFTGIWSSRSYRTLDRGQFFTGLLTGVPAQETGSWAFYYNVDQHLYVDPSNPKRAWGVFLQSGISDGNPCPIRWITSVGLSGSSLIASREADTFGVGYFYTGLSQEVKTLTAPLLLLDDEQGVEMYYNIAVTRWFALTADVQFINPANERRDTAVVPGLRAKLDF